MGDEIFKKIYDDYIVFMCVFFGWLIDFVGVYCV